MTTTIKCSKNKIAHRTVSTLGTGIIAGLNYAGILTMKYGIENNDIFIQNLGVGICVLTNISLISSCSYSQSQGCNNPVGYLWNTVHDTVDHFIPKENEAEQALLQTGPTAV